MRRASPPGPRSGYPPQASGPRCTSRAGRQVEVSDERRRNPRGREKPDPGLGLWPNPAGTSESSTTPTVNACSRGHVRRRAEGGDFAVVAGTGEVVVVGGTTGTPPRTTTWLRERSTPSSHSSAACHPTRSPRCSERWTKPRSPAPLPSWDETRNPDRACSGHDRYPHRKQVFPHRPFLTGLSSLGFPHEGRRLPLARAMGKRVEEQLKGAPDQVRRVPLPRLAGRECCTSARRSRCGRACAATSRRARAGARRSRSFRSAWRTSR